jgi:pimeloyl-ACP methyl ester carboxylesterase
VVLCLPDGGTATDPDPGETAKRDVELAAEWDGTPAAVVGVGDGGWKAVELAAAHGDLVERLALVATPPSDDVEPQMVSAKTLLLYGSLDGGQKRATWWKNRLGGRIEMVPGAGDDILERVWLRVLSHVAPGSLRK